MDDRKLEHDDHVQVAKDAESVLSTVDELARERGIEQDLENRRAHLEEVEKRLERDDYSPKKRAQYQAAYDRAVEQIEALEEEQEHLSWG